MKAKAQQEGANLNIYLSIFGMLEKCFHFISQSLLMAHLLGRDPRTSWRKDSRHRTTTHTGEEHLTPLLVPLQLRGFAWPSSSSHIHRQNHSGLVGSDRSRASSGLRQVTDYPDPCHLLSLRAKERGCTRRQCSFCSVHVCLFTLNSPRAFWQHY